MPIKKNFFLFFFLLTFFLPSLVKADGLVPCGLIKDDFTVIGDQSVPCTICHLIVGTYNIFTWFKNILVIAALVAIFVGGVMYIVSAGNEQAITTAKAVLKNSLYGFIFVLVAWLCIYTVMWILSVKGTNGNHSEGFLGIGKDGWTVFTCSTESSTTTDGENENRMGGSGRGGAGGGTTDGYLKACKDGPSVAKKADFTDPENGNDPDIKLNTNCNDFSFTNTYGVNENMLKTIAQIESSCNPNTGSSGAHACGLMQILPSTAKGLDSSYFQGMSSSQICHKLSTDPNLSIKLAAKYIANNNGKHSGNIQKILAGYNGGYGEGGSGPLATSADCKSIDPNILKFECCKDPQELDETINYVYNGVGICRLLGGCS